jgi:PAS domain S-box-containing protein
MRNIFGRSSRVGVPEPAQDGALPARRFSRGREYGLALVLVAAAALTRWALPEVLGLTPYLAFYLAWVGAAAFGGLGPGLLATAASWLCVDLLFDTTPWQTTFGDPVTLGRMAFLLASGTAVSLVAERLRRARLFERRQATEVARAKQEWERTFDAVPDLISIIDRNYRILRVNRAMAERLGVPPERCIGLTCYQCIHELDAPPAVCPHAQCLADGRTHTAEVYEERSDSHFLITCTPLFDPRGQWMGSVHVARDITARKRTEEELKRSESILKQAGEVAHLGAWEIEFTASADIIQSPLRWSDEVYRLFGYAPRAVEVSNDLFFRQVHPGDRQRVRDAIAQALAEKRPYQIEHRLVRSDGTERIVLEHGEIKFDEQGRPRQMIGAVQDITERRQADQTLRENEERLRAIFDYAGIGLAEAAEGRFIAVNDRFCEILGYARDELLGKTVPELTAPDDRATSDLLNAQLQEGQTDQIDYEKRYLRRDGTPVWAHVIVSAIHDPEGRHRRGIATVEDISQRKQMEEQLRDWNAMLETKVAQRTAELQQRARQLQRLTLELSETEDRERQRMAEILHDDLQQVLAAAKYHVSLMRNRVKQDSFLDTTAGQVNQMLKEAIEKSRSLSHELSPAVLHYSDLAETLRWLASQVKAKHGLVVHVHAPDPVHLPSAALQGFLYKAAQELLFNVVKHARVKEARIRARQHGRGIGLSVSDRGSGFDPQELQGAAGFGLLNIRERVEQLGGRMKIRSAKGKGSTFFIVVPCGEKPEDRRQKTDDGKKADKEAPSSVLRPPPPGPTVRVLLADDHEVVRQGLVSLLSEVNAVEIVGEAANGREAVDLADRLRPDVVIMDVSMPVMSGDEAARQIKKELPQTRIIALSMWDESEVRERMYRAGAEGYVLKTAPSEELLAAIRGPGPDAAPMESVAGGR